MTAASSRSCRSPRSPATSSRARTTSSAGDDLRLERGEHLVEDDVGVGKGHAEAAARRDGRNRCFERAQEADAVRLVAKAKLIARRELRTGRLHGTPLRGPGG